MPLSNTTLDTLRAQPYWDDYNKDARFHRVLFRPKYPVQTREVNQIQSIFQNQIEQLASGSYREGDAVRGGGQALINSCHSLQLTRNDNIDIANFYNANTGEGYVVRGATSDATAKIIEIARQSGEDFTAVIVVPTNAKIFTPEETINFYAPDDTETVVASMVAAPTTTVSPTRPSLVYTVSSGSFFVRGCLVESLRQSTVLSSSTRAVSRRIGFDVTEEIITEVDDLSLLDPALGTSNFSGPGAHRLKITLTLVSKPIVITPTDLLDSEENFVEIARVVDGRLVEPVGVANGRTLDDILAQRTFEESGNYVVDPFQIVPSVHLPDVVSPNCRGAINVLNTSNVVSAADITSSVVVDPVTQVTTRTTTAFTEDIEVGDILIVGNERREVTQIVNNTTLRINTEFSFDYTEVPYVVESDNRMTFILDSGVAYVQGYRIATDETSYVEVRRPRTTRAIDNGAISTRIGPYLTVTRGKGLLSLNTTPVIDLHCVNTFSNVFTTAAYSNTKIGTARFRGLLPVESDGLSGTGDTSTTLYKLYYVAPEFETKTYNAVVIQDKDTSAFTLSLNNALMQMNTNHALVGARIVAYNSANVALRYTVVADTYNSSTDRHLITLSSGALMSDISNAASKTFSVIFNEKCIRAISGNSSAVAGATVAVQGRIGGVQSGATVVQATGSTPAMFMFNQSWISANTLEDVSYDGFVYLKNISRGTLETIDSKGYYPFVLTRPSSAVAFRSTTSFSNGYVYLDVVASNTSTGALDLTEAKIDYSTENPTLYINSAIISTSTSIDVYARARITVDTTTLRTKTLRTANTNTLNVQVASSALLSNLSIGRGHIAINTINSSSPKIISLGVADVYQVKKVYAVTSINATNIVTSVDVTDRYALDNGQRDWCYDHASLVLRPGFAHYPASHRLLVMVDWFQHSSNSGPFFARSYADSGLLDGYNDIPQFVNTRGGLNAPLRDMVDFRPTRVRDLAAADIAYNPYTPANTVFHEQDYPSADGLLLADYEHYLGRIDNIIIRANGQITSVTGVPSTAPRPPAEEPNSALLYQIQYPPYLANVNSLTITSFDNRRFTMSDIGTLQKRIERLEYYATLSLVENQTLQDPEYDDNDNERFKNGILVDQFTGYSVADASNPEYKASMDSHEGELWPRQFSYNVKLQTFDTGTMRNHVNRMITVPWTLSNLIVQPYATKQESVNPYNVAIWNSRITLDPSSDTWFDTERLPTVTRNISNENDNWLGLGLSEDQENELGENGSLVLSTEWGPGTWHWQGKLQKETRRPPEYIPMDNPYDDDPRQEYIKKTTSLTIGTRVDTRVGLEKTIKRSTVLTELGDSIVDLAVVPYMRAANVMVMTTGLLPGSELFATFDNKDVSTFVERSNYIALANEDVASQFIAGFSFITYSGGDPTNNLVGRGKIAGVTGSVLRVVDTVGRIGPVTGGAEIRIRQTIPTDTLHPVTGEPVSPGSIDAAISSYQHFSGAVRSDSAAGSTSIQLDTGANLDAGSYVGNTIFITYVGSSKTAGIINASNRADGLQRSYTITAYDTATRTVTIDTPLALGVVRDVAASTPGDSDAQIATRYSIGPLLAESDIPDDPDAPRNPEGEVIARNPGAFYGMFRLPGGKFSVGSKVFRLADNVVSLFATTTAEGVYTASGTKKVVQGTTLRNRSTVVIPKLVNETSSSQYELETTEYEATGCYVDPLAQTFLIDKQAYPEGVFLAAVDLCFAKISSKKEKFIVQIRETKDGNVTEKVKAELSRSGSEIDQFKVVPLNEEGTNYVTPDFTNPAHYTRFSFEEPVYLEAGFQYALVLISNDANYRVFIAEMNKQVVGSTQIISEQPYTGSLFYSQNGSTWTPQQAEDLMFRMHRCSFDTSRTFSFAVKMNETVNKSTPGILTDAAGNFDFDVCNLNVEDKTYFESSKVGYSLRTYNKTANQFDVYTPDNGLVLNENLYLPDRATLLADNNTSVMLTIAANTTSNAVSPVFVLPSMALTTVQYVIDNGELYSNGFVILNPGSDYTPSSTFGITVGDGYGTGAAVVANVNATGYVESITVSEQGSGYIETPTLTWSTTTTGSNAVIEYRGETSAQSSIFGEIKTRYVTRPGRLVDGFDAGDLKVYVLGSRPAGTHIDVYYKVLSSGDSTSFDQRPWQRMIMKPGTENSYTTSMFKVRDFEFKTKNNTTQYTSNEVQYDRFNVFAIKIVLRTENKSIVPRLKDLRVLALDT